MAKAPLAKTPISRRNFLAVAGGFGAGLLLAACGGTVATPSPVATTRPSAAPSASASAGASAAPAASTQPSAASAPANLVLHISDGIRQDASTGKPGEGKFGTWFEAEVFTTHLQKFQEQNPTIKVTVDWFQGSPYTEKLFAKKAAGQLGDIVHGLGIAIDVAAKNELYRPLDDLAKTAGFDLAQFTPAAVEVLRFDPKSGQRGTGAPLYGLPSQGNPSAIMLFFNPEMFAKKGVKAPAAGMAWNDVLQAGLAMTDRKSGSDVADVYGWLLSPSWGTDVVNTWLRDFGGNMFDETGKKALLNTPEAKGAFQFIYDAIYKHKVSPRPDQLQALGNYKAMFLQQKLAMYRMPPWGVLATSDMPLKGQPGYFEWDAVVMPPGPSGQGGNNLSATHIGVTPNSKFPDQAFKVLSWVTNKDAGVLQCFNAGMCGPRPDTLGDAQVKASKFLATVNAASPSAKRPNFATNGRDSEAFGLLAKELDKLLNDQAKPDDAFFGNMNTLVQGVLDKPLA